MTGDLCPEKACGKGGGSRYKIIILYRLPPPFCPPALFPNEGGPAILEVSVPAWMMAILYADPIAAGLARGGEIRFEPESGLTELRAEWHTLTKRVIPL